MVNLSHVSHVYASSWRRGRVQALQDCSLHMQENTVFGIAGPNGAGKSTMIRILLGFAQPTKGHAEVGGLRPSTYRRRHGVSYLPESFSAPPTWTVHETLSRYGALSIHQGFDVRLHTEHIISTFELAPILAKPIHQLSKGALQRLALAQALLPRRDLIVLDEPTNGFDPVWIRRFRRLVSELKAVHRVLVIASHDLAELERIADKVAILCDGRLARIVSPGTVAQRTAYRIELENDSHDLSQFAPTVMTIAGNVVTVEGGLGAANDLLRRLINAGIPVTRFAPIAPSLEDEFVDAIQLTEGL